MQDVTAAIIIENNKVLLTRRAPGEKHAGWWEFPGGKIEDGETPEKCLLRELTEELGIHTSVGAKITESVYEYEAGAIRLMAYRATILSGDPCLHVHDDYQWVRIHELTQFQLLPADVPIAEYLQEMELKNTSSGGTLC
jgi:8-oxo-dGTP diphosphatase